MFKEFKNKVEEKANEVKEIVTENKKEIATVAIVSGLMISGIVVTHKINKNHVDMWRKAMDAWKSSDLDYDFDPYKVCRFFEPKTGEQIGHDMMMHKKSVEAFLNVK